MCVSDMCDGDCTSELCGKHVYMIVHVFVSVRAFFCGWYGWMMRACECALTVCVCCAVLMLICC